MLRITQQSSSSGAKSYYTQADYLSEGKELVGQWGGRGSSALGLEGLVQKEPFDFLCDNLRPDGSGSLTERTREDRTIGYDWTFNAPKSLSVLYGLTNDTELLHAFQTSVRETMIEAEQGMESRVRKKDSDVNRTTSNMIWAEFTHTTARPVNGLPDPHLHTHVFVFNATFDGVENKWKAGQFQNLKRDAPYYEAAFHARLATKVKDLGYDIERTKNGWEIEGLPNRVLKEFSQRTRVIEAKAKAKGITDPDQKAELGASTREAKESTLSYPELQQIWKDRLAESERDAVQYTRDHRSPKRLLLPDSKAQEQALQASLEHCFTNSAVIPERKLLADVLRRGVGHFAPEQVKQHLKSYGVLFRQKEGKTFVTTREVLQQENHLIDFAKRGRGSLLPIQSGSHTFKRSFLNSQQRVAIEHVLNSRDRITLIRGVAGTGKTTLMKEAVEAIQHQGFPVTVLAPSVDASRGVLREEGFSEANTVAHFVQDQKMQNKTRNGVIWIDEAGLLTLNQTTQVFQLAQDLDARIVLSGDRQQHSSVERGDLLKLLEEEAGLPQASVTVIQRQEKEEYKQAVQDLSEGKVTEGLQKLDQLGWVHEITDQQERETQLAKVYCDSLQELRDPKKVLVISPTHAEKDSVTEAIRQERKQRGELGTEQNVTIWEPMNWSVPERKDPLNYEEGMLIRFHKPAPKTPAGTKIQVEEGTKLPLEYAERFTVYQAKDITLAEGDRVRITAPCTSQDGKHRLNRGGMYSVKGFSPQGGVVLDNGWSLSPHELHLDHGYVTTSHASQGKTVAKVLIAQSSQSRSAASPEQVYVSASRAKQQVLVFTDSKEELLQSVNKKQERMSAKELSRAQKPTSERKLRRERFAHIQRMMEFEKARASVPTTPNRVMHYDRDG